MNYSIRSFDVLNKMEEDENTIYQMRFPQKLWYLLNLHTDALLWGGTGRTILLNYRILHNYLQCDNSIFKTTNISSFVRQLNLYGFRKVTSHLQDPLCNSSNPYMHEYVHDYFQYGRPELLNKITRKALTLKKNFKTKCLSNNIDQSSYITPLQKARRALRIALRKAAQDLFVQHSPKRLCNLKFESEEYIPDDFYEDEQDMEFDWFVQQNKTEKQAPQPDTTNTSENSQIDTDNSNYCSSSHEKELINFNETSEQTHIFPSQFLSMPELDPLEVPTEDKSGVELLAEFDINNDINQGIVRKIARNEDKSHNSLNCVLPSISNECNDDVSITEKNDHNSDHYHGEWDQMFNEIIANKSSSQECGSELKELYSQISKTIDLFNS